MILTALHPDAGERVDLGDPGARDRLAELYRPPARFWLRVNSVLSVSGGVTGSDGSSDSLTSPADRALLGVIRGLADVVLVGAGSVRSEGYQLPKRTPLAVVTGSGDLGGHRFGDAHDPDRLIVLCPPEAAPVARRTLGSTPHRVVPIEPDADAAVSASGIVGVLRGRGLSAIVCEGGPSLATHLIAAGLVDELCLTTSPVFTGPGPSFLDGPGLEQRRLELRRLLIDDAGALYARWFVTTGASGGEV